jgi:hypothetical protein
VLLLVMGYHSSVCESRHSPFTKNFSLSAISYLQVVMI